MVKRYDLSDTARAGEIGVDINIGSPVTALDDAMTGITFRTKGEGANPQLPAVVFSDTRNANDVLAMEQLRGR